MYKCIKSFAGNIVSMKKGDTIEYLDKELAKDYLKAGFIIEEEAKEIKEDEATLTVVKTTAKKQTSKKKK